ncbi:hypothetical protein ISP17_18185 [Dyella ginsengisoli]|jgi:hypothetical protein|uniref:Toxin co-regulated pilus biosynthesis protein Q C-terminal domain-containing protein n=1 Tax=Dyella ginsengisoli TaxID=363848 RepID=A0ABW8JXK8_9GAMM
MLVGPVLLASLAMTACGTPPAKDFRGSWKPVNRFQDAPVEIPLDQPYTFYAAPMDETLKSMLDRWAKDTGRTLTYELGFDVTLYKPVADIHTTNLEDAASRLNEIYGAQGVLVIAHPREIVVRAPAAAAAPTAAQTTPRAAGVQP